MARSSTVIVRSRIVGRARQNRAEAIGANKRRRSVRPLIAGFAAGIWITLSATSFTPLLAGSTGSIKGQILFVGKLAQSRPVEMPDNYKEKCGTKKSMEELVVSPDRGIANAVVTLVDVKGKAISSAKNFVLDQTGCAFNPHLLIVPAGASVDILNNDGFLHNVHTYSTKNPPFNKAQPSSVKKISTTFSQPEIIRVGCDVHPWMSGWIVVTKHPHAVSTSPDGSFQFAEVPAGTHTLEVWHETLGKVKKQVVVEPGTETHVAIELKGE